MILQSPHIAPKLFSMRSAAPSKATCASCARRTPSAPAPASHARRCRTGSCRAAPSRRSPCAPVAREKYLSAIAFIRSDTSRLKRFAGFDLVARGADFQPLLLLLGRCDDLRERSSHRIEPQRLVQPCDKFGVAREFGGRRHMGTGFAPGTVGTAQMPRGAGAAATVILALGAAESGPICRPPVISI